MFCINYFSGTLIFGTQCKIGGEKTRKMGEKAEVKVFKCGEELWSNKDSKSLGIASKRILKARSNV